MNTKILTLLIATLMMSTPLVAAYDQTVAVTFNVDETPSNTEFTISQIGLNFTAQTGTNVVPALENSNNPWATLTNGGNVNETIKMTYTPGAGAPATIKIGTTNIIGDITTKDVGSNMVIAIVPDATHGTNIQNLYAWANFSGINPVTHTGSLNVNSTKAP